MNMLAAQEIKRCGIGAVDGLIGSGPVFVIKNNRPQYVVLREEDYSGLLSELAEARLAASESDLAAGRVRRGASARLMKELAAE
jgi:PHD/YefM family antitoxin component YafN of YafNO toxin-antitoxin module